MLMDFIQELGGGLKYFLQLLQLDQSLAYKSSPPPHTKKKQNKQQYSIRPYIRLPHKFLLQFLQFLPFLYTHLINVGHTHTALPTYT